jgi:hypothetical protein
MMTKNRIETMVTTLNACKQPSGRGTSADVPHKPPIKERKTARQIEAFILDWMQANGVCAEVSSVAVEASGTGCGPLA